MDMYVSRLLLHLALRSRMTFVDRPVRMRLYMSWKMIAVISKTVAKTEGNALCYYFILSSSLSHAKNIAF